MSFQAYLDTIKAQTGKTPEDFLALATEKGLLEPGVKATEIVEWLKEDYSLGYGHAMAIVNTFRHAIQPPVTNDERVAKLFTGPRKVWRDSYDSLLATISEFGPDVRTAPTDTYISLLRGNNKFGIVQVTSTRMGIGVKLKDADYTPRFEAAGAWNAMVTHRVHVTNASQLNDELMTWLKRAYDKAV